jgi:hypothetical protein
MKRLSAGPVLLLVGAVVFLVGLPLQWSSVSFPDGTTIALRGIDYASYDIVTTVVLGLALIVAAFGVAGARRWGVILGVVAALLACMWGALVVVAAANPSADAGSLSGVNVSIGLGAYAVAAGAVVALIGAVLSFRGRSVAVVTSGVPSSV